MFNTPEDALERIKPLIPDMGLAKQALANELPTCPEWVVEGILFLLSNTLMVEDVKEKILDKEGRHWLTDTIPYIVHRIDYNSN